MNYNFDIVDDTAQDALLVSYPAVQWIHGDNKLKQVGGVMYQGGFFFPYEQAGEGAEIANWVPTTRSTKSGKDVTGIGAHRAGITIVRYRRRWFREQDGRKEFRSWNQYEPGFRGQMQAVGFIKGWDSPVTFTWKGMAIQNIQAVIQEHARKVVAEANKATTNGKRLPLYAFYMGIEAGKFEAVGQGNDTSTITPPVIVLPNIIDPSKLYVGEERLLESQRLFHEVNDWVKLWEKGGQENAPPAEAPVPRAEAAAALQMQSPAAWQGEEDDTSIPF